MTTAPTVSYQHRVALFPQPTGMTCWSAATTMLFGNVFSAGPGAARAGSTGGLQSDFKNIFTFAGSYGLRVYPLMSWTVDGIVKLIKKGPVAMLGAIPSLHAVVISGVRSDGTPRGTILTIYDPWPPNKGAIYSVDYLSLVTNFPMATMYMLQR